MMNVSKNRVDQFLLTTQVMVENTLSDSGVKTALAGYGFSENKLSLLRLLPPHRQIRHVQHNPGK
jgi:hypothetical protein